MPEFSSNHYQNGTDHTAEFDLQDIAQNRVVSALSYLLILFFLPLVCCKDSKFGRFHANQGLLLFITSVVLGVVEGVAGGILHFIPFLGGLAFWAFRTVIGLAVLLLIIYGLINTLNGKARELPFIGKIHILD